MKILASLTLTAGLLLVGCDSSSDGEPGGPGDFFISPDSVTLPAGESTATFRVSGGTEPMTWAVADGGLGSITATSGRIANYARNGNTQGGNEITVTDVIGLRARALVVQSGDGPSLSISPSRVTLTTADESVTLVARGGDAPFTWAVIDSSLGSLSSTGQSAANYIRNGDAAGQNIVELKDANGTLATATIVQDPVP